MKHKLPYFSNEHRKGFLGLAMLIVILQGVLFLVKSNQKTEVAQYSVDAATERYLDSLGELALKKYEMQPFNPNFITDAKGFKLGMTTQEIDRLLQYRASGKYVNSAAEFQKITGVSNNVLDKIAPYFKFPEWTQNPKPIQKSFESLPAIKKIDINKATFEELVTIKGIGDYFANAVINEREQLKGFVSTDQLRFIKGLRPEAVKILQQNTFVGKTPHVKKVNVNTASKEDLEQVPYVSAYLARQIVILRSKQDQPLNIEDLEKINNFPLDKLKIIRLYLDF
ncbi:MAG: helix-hairpin-helix domain-containing protein [Myroides sp.]|nr:helix-hairpin-helix domain-containing protein [Myroides sp.]